MEFLVLSAVVVGLALVAAVVMVGMPKGPALKDVAHLQHPVLLEMSPQKVLLVRAKGNPNQVGKAAFGLLMKSYFRLKGVPKGGRSFKPPRARWPVEADQPMEEWDGLYAMPVPNSVEEAPQVDGFGDLTVELDTWEYGMMAQILHVGAYDQEPTTVRILREFVAEEGYEFAGLHEEEYLRGPGLLFAGNPAGYLTLIRYPVRKLGGQ